MISAMKLVAGSSVLCIVDLQERLLAAMPAAGPVVERAGRLARGAALLSVPALLVEQYPRGLGRTPAEVADGLPPPFEKMSFSCCDCRSFVEALPAGASSAVLCGLETHVCVAQTALDLLERGLDVFVVADAVMSRHAIDHDVALRRLEASGAVVTTSEAVLFEWCRSAEHPQFQAVRRLVL